MALPIITPLTPDDLDAVMLLERQIFTEPWTRRMYLSDLTKNELATYLAVRPAPAIVADAGWATGDWQQGAVPPGATVAAEDAPVLTVATSEDHPAGTEIQLMAPILGWGGFWLMVDEAHIATVASHPDYRGCGLGQWLMLELMAAAQSRGAAIVTLEVRAGNAPAIKLYDKLGFLVAGERVAYYRDGETALIMTTPRLDEPALQERLASARQDALNKLKRCFES